MIIRMLWIPLFLLLPLLSPWSLKAGAADHRPGIADDRSKMTDNGDTIVLTAEDIGATKALKIADVLNHVPGVKAGDSSVGIHGSYKVKVYLDGRPINDPTSNHGGVNWDLLSPDDVVRIEILRGKGGLLYGQDASGGVILITTRKVRRLTGNIKAYGGNYGARNARALVNTTAGKFTVGVGGGYETTDGFKVNNDKERYQVGLKLGYDPGEKRNIAFSADYLQDERGLSGYPDYPTPHSRKKTQNVAYALQADGPKLKSKTSYNEGQRHNTDSSTGLDKKLTVSKFEQDITTTFRSFQRGDLNCGVSGTWDRADGTSFDDQEEYSASLFAVQSLTWPKIHTTLTAGLRGVYQSAFDNVVNPEVKLVYHKPAWRLTAAYSRTNNTPSFYQRYNETSSTQPNPDLQMEGADNYSLALFAAPAKPFSFSLTLFYNLLTDRITYVTGSGGMGQYQNFGEVLYTGADAALSWKVHATFNAKGAYTYLEVKDQETDLWVPGKAQHVVNIALYWQPLQPLSMVATAKHASKVYRNKSNTKTVSAYTIADVRVEYGFKQFSLFGEVKNIFDETYYYADGLLAPPRTWLAGVNWRI
jgi:iron complex outermembrane receptor protein